ncbi:MAG TPA: hypothetical protein VGN17_14385 [Bryobacteraceae bacterium]|jgi:hypothetical protein
MAVSSNRKVLVARFERETLPGFVQTPGGLEGDAVELLDPKGSLIRVPLIETKVVCFVRDFEDGETWRKNRSFATRPKTAGLWVRFKFRDGDWLEGIVANNLLQIESTGFHSIPPDPSFQNQRIFVPRAALAGVEVLGVIGSPLRKRTPSKATPDEGQLKMFE